jgi:hypothetical protein
MRESIDINWGNRYTLFQINKHIFLGVIMFSFSNAIEKTASNKVLFIVVLVLLLVGDIPPVS